MKIPDLKPYAWVMYPLSVLTLIIFALSFLAGGPTGAWQQALDKKRANSENQKTLARLNSKLDYLKQVNTGQTAQDLAMLLKAVPEKKHFDLLVNQLRYSAALSGSTLEGYKGDSVDGSTDFKLSVNFIVPDFLSAQKLLAALHSSLPLLSVTSTTYSANRLTVELTSAWAPITPANVKIDESLPEYLEKLAKLKSVLANYQLPAVSDNPVSAPVDNSPLSTDPFQSLPVSN